MLSVIIKPTMLVGVMLIIVLLNFIMLSVVLNDNQNNDTLQKSISTNNGALSMIMSSVTTQPTMPSLTRLILVVLNVIMLSTATSWQNQSSLCFIIFP
jgi:hypothetical protein